MSNGAATNVRLSETMHVYDPMDRPTRRDIAYFEPSTQTPLGDGQSTKLIGYSDASDIILLVDDNGRVTQTTYDSTLEPHETTDPKATR